MLSSRSSGMPARNAIFLFGAALIWGVAFVAQSVGMDYMGPFAFNALRFLLGSAVLLPVILYRGRRGAGDRKKEAAATADRKRTVLAGVFCGCCLFMASMSQQIGIMTTDVGKAGFLTAMYIVIVPALSFAVTRRTSLRLWLSVLLACAGLYCLSISDSLVPESGDIWLIACAFLFSMHIMCIDHFADVDGVKLSCIQFLTAGILAAGGCVLREGAYFRLEGGGLLSVMYAGIMSCGVAYTFQILGQQGADPGAASLILSLESVISVIAGFVILHQTLTMRELLGCLIMFIAIILVQLPAGAAERGADADNSF